METSKLKTFAQVARTDLRKQVASKLDLVREASSAARRENPQAVAQLDRQIQESSRELVIEKIAYTWFNRFCALRFLDVNGYTNPRVLTPMEGQITPEILAEAKMGHLDEELVTGTRRQKILDLLAGKAPSTDPQGEAYRLLLVSVCNHWYRHMPFLFEQIDDYTELLMPEDLLSQGSILTSLREVMLDVVCRDVEVIGWLYQFYITEKKDEVFAGLKKNIKITAENIPAATQLFTPHWIVRYLVENSLGRLWLLNRPQSKLAAQMDYYIAPEEPETDFLRISRPEEIRICDPACGSGHMLTYAFDLLYAIYEEEGYDPTEIPALILTHNLYGVEIDDRAGALAAFALVMKAAARLGRRRFLRMETQPNICVLQNVSFTQDELHDVVAIMGRDLFSDELRETLMQFEQAKNFGSLIVPKLRDPAETLRTVEALDFGGDLLLKEVQARVEAVLRMAEALSPKYHAVVANPPYKKRGDLNSKLQGFLVDKYPDCFSDLYAAFIDRLNKFCRSKGLCSMIAMDSWLFGDDYKEMRARLLSSSPFQQLAHLGPRAFDEIKGEVVQVACFVSQRDGDSDRRGAFFDLTKGQTSSEKSLMLRGECKKYLARASDFTRLPRNVVAYFVSDHTRQAYAEGLPLKDLAEAFTGLQTGDNERFIRCWSELSVRNTGVFPQPLVRDGINVRWVKYVKGSEYRKWYGNGIFVLDWRNGGEEIIAHPSARPQNREHYFKQGVAYNNIANQFSARRVFGGSVFDQKNSMFVAESESDLDLTLALLHSNAMPPLLRVVAAKDFGPGAMKLLPLPKSPPRDAAVSLSRKCVSLARSDWDAYETSWDFTKLPLLLSDHRAGTLEAAYVRLRALWQVMTAEMKALEEENNRIFIDAYGLQDELIPEVSIEEITLTCNPAYRYGVKVTEEDREKRLLSDTMVEFLSYAVGCMFGRYSLDKPGLVLANQGEALADYLQQVPEPCFMPDEDNVIPVLDGEWFADDVTERFRQFLRVTFGEEHYEENLGLIEKALGKEVRKYFLRDFYADHLKRYNKRPIYWLFSSPKGTFNALVYMHRYRPDTVSVVLQYLRDFRKKLAARLDYLQQVAISTLASQGEKTKSNKEAESIKKQLLELDDYERETLYPLATEQVQLDLDDGVKVNYLKLGATLKKIPGLEAKED
jgi:hypothetical protein